MTTLVKYKTVALTSWRSMVRVHYRPPRFAFGYAWRSQDGDDLKRSSARHSPQGDHGLEQFGEVMIYRRDKEIISLFKDELSKKLQRPVEAILDKGLSVYDFAYSKEVKLKFPDDSTAHFKYAFAVWKEDRGTIAVFTEHCGYHVFPGHDLKVIE